MEINTTCADEYFTNKLSCENWFELTESQKSAMITEAKEKIFHLSFIGQKADIFQNEPFPRFYKGMYITLPDDIVKAVFEETLHLINQKNSTNFNDIPDNVQSMSLGSASISFSGNKSGIFENLAQSAKDLTEGWLKKGFDIEQEKFKETY